MESGNYADLIFFAIVAVVILLKLRSVLGKQDHSGDVAKFLKDQRAASEVVDLKTGDVVNGIKALVAISEPEPEIEDKTINKTIDDIKKIYPEFSLGQFLSGANMAFEMVLESFSKHDKDTLKELLSKELYTGFVKEINSREKAGKFVETTLISILSVDVKDVVLNKNKVQVEVEFVSEQINVEKDKDGNKTKGQSSKVAKIVDNWIFEKDIKASNPNWEIIGT